MLARRLVIIGTTCLAAAACASQGTQSAAGGGNAPLPSDVNIVPPGPSVPKDLAAYSGKWEGKWDGQMDTKLVVEDITSPSTITIIYGWGTNYYEKKPGWARQRAEFANGELIARFPNGSLVQYRLRSDGSLAGSYEGMSNWGPFSLTGRLTRQA